MAVVRRGGSCGRSVSSVEIDGWNSSRAIGSCSRSVITVESWMSNHSLKMSASKSGHSLSSSHQSANSAAKMSSKRASISSHTSSAVSHGRTRVGNWHRLGYLQGVQAVQVIAGRGFQPVPKEDRGDKQEHAAVGFPVHGVFHGFCIVE